MFQKSGEFKVFLREIAGKRGSFETAQLRRDTLMGRHNRAPCTSLSLGGRRPGSRELQPRSLQQQQLCSSSLRTNTAEEKEGSCLQSGSSVE